MLVKTDIGAAGEALQQVFQPRTDIPATNTQQAIELVKAGLASALGAGFIVDAASSDLTAERVATDTITVDVDMATPGQARWNVLELPGIDAAGIVARTGAANYEARTITGTTNEITATDGDGVAGNPTLSFPTNIILTGKNIDEVEKLGVNTTADSTNRLSVNSDAVLFNHNGATSQVKVNKAATGDTASHLFQVGFSGRAEFGLIGSDDFQMKTSPDGSSFTTGLTILNSSAALRAHINLSPFANDGAALGTTALGWADAFFATGGTIHFANTDWVATHSTGVLTVGTGDLRVTTAGANAASVVTVGGTQTLTAKTLTSPVINTGIELGHATDTTLTRVSAGVVAIEGVNILTTATGQPLDSDLTAIAALTTTAYGRDLLTRASAVATQSYIGVREVLTANRTYYVRTDGSDSNTGLVDSAGGAFLTPQKAYDVIADTLDLSAYVVTIQLGNGTYSAGAGTAVLFISRPWVGGKGPGGAGAPGGGAVHITGDRTTPGNVIFEADAKFGIFVNCGLPGCFDVSGIKFQDTAGGGTGLFNNASGATVNIADLDFGEMGSGASKHMWAAQCCTIFCFDEDYTISGDASVHMLIEVGGRIDVELGTITLTGTPAFSVAFARVEGTGHYYSASNYSGAATGKRFLVRSSGSITLFTDTFGELGSAALTRLPGSVAGEFSGGTLNEYGGFAGLRIGFSGAPTDDKIEIGDDQFHLDFNSGNPIIVLDANDYLVYDRANNSLVFHIGNRDALIIDGNGNVTGRYDLGGLGYGPGAGGAVTQITSKATGVTLNKICGTITTHNASLAAGAEVSFTVTNSVVAAGDTIIANIASGATVNTYMISVTAVAAGSFRIGLTNVGATLGEALVINFAVIRAVSA